MILYPSETARLVLGYLIEMKCWMSAEIFLKESPHLEEHRYLVKNGMPHCLNINDKSLCDYLAELCCEKGNREKMSDHVGGFIERIDKETQTENLDKEVSVESSLVNEVLLNCDETYTTCSFDSTSSKSTNELVLKITDTFSVTDEFFANQTSSPNINSQKNSRHRRKSCPSRKLLIDSLVCKKLDNYGKQYTLDALQKDMVFLEQLLCDHPVVQKLAYVLNRVKKKAFTSVKEIVQKAVTEFESNIFVHAYFTFLRHQTDFYMSFRKSRHLNSDECHKRSVVSKKVHKTNCLNLEECVAEDVVDCHLKNPYVADDKDADNKMLVSNDICPDTLNFANTDESTSTVGVSIIQNPAQETSRLSSQSETNTSSSVKEIHLVDHSLPVSTKNAISKSLVTMPIEAPKKLNSDLKDRQLIPEKTYSIQSINIESSNAIDLALNVTNTNESISVVNEPSDIQSSPCETSTLPSESNTNRPNTSNVTNEILSDDQSSVLSLLSHFQPLIPGKIDNIKPANTECNTSGYSSMTMFQNNNFPLSSNQFMKPQFPSTCLNRNFIPNSSNMYLILDNFLYQIITRPTVPMQNSNLCETSLPVFSSISNCTQNINIPFQTSVTNSLVPPNNSILLSSSNSSQLSNSSVVSTTSNNLIMSTFSNNFSSTLSNVLPPSLNYTSRTISSNVLSASSNDVILPAATRKNNLPLLTNLVKVPLSNSTQCSSVPSNALSASVNNTSLTVSSNVLSAPTNDIILPVPTEKNNLPLFTNIINATLSNTTQYSTVLSNELPASSYNITSAVSNILPVLSNGINLPNPARKNNLPLVTNIINRPLHSTNQLNTDSFYIPTLNNKNITQLPINSPHMTNIVGTLQDVKLIITDDTENTEKESTKSIPDTEKQILSEDEEKSKKTKDKNNKCKKGNNKIPTRNQCKALSCINTNLKKKQQCRRSTRKIIQCTLFNSASQKHPVIPSVTKNINSEGAMVNDRTQLHCSSRTYLKVPMSNYIVKNNCSENVSLSTIPFDSASNNSCLKNKNSICTKSGFHEEDISNCTNSAMYSAENEIARPLACDDYSTILNNADSDMNSKNDEIIFSSESLSNSSIPVSTKCYIDTLSDETTTNLEVLCSLNTTGNINSDASLPDDQTTMPLESHGNSTLQNNVNSDVDVAGEQTTMSLPSVKDCARFSNTPVDSMRNYEIDEEDIPLSELLNKIADESHSVRKFEESSSRKGQRKFSHTSISEEIKESAYCSNILEDRCNTVKKMNKSEDTTIALSYSSILNSFLLPPTKKHTNQKIPMEIKNLCTIPSVPEHLKSSSDKIQIKVNDLSVISSFKSPSKFQNNTKPVSSHAFQSDDALDNKNAFISHIYNDCSKKTNDNHDVFKKCKTIANLDHNIELPETKQKKNSSKKISKTLKRFSKQKKRTSHSDVANLKTDDKICLETFNFQAQTKSLYEIPSFLEHLNSCEETRTEKDNALPMSLLLKDCTLVQNTLNPVIAESIQCKNSLVEKVDDAHALPQNYNGCSKQTNDSHVGSMKCEAISNLDQNTKSSETKRKMDFFEEASKIKLPKKCTKQKKETFYSDLAVSTKKSNFSVEIKNLCIIPSSPGHSISSHDGTVELCNSSVSPAVNLSPKNTSSLQNNINPDFSDGFQINNTFVEISDNKHAFLSDTGNCSVKYGSKNSAVSRKCDINSNLGQDIKLSETKRKNSSVEISKRKLPERLAKQKEMTSLSNLANLKSNDKANLENSSNFQAQAKNLYVAPSLPEQLSSCDKAKAEMDNSSPAALLSKDDIQNTIYPVVEESLQCEDSPAERLDNTHALFPQGHKGDFKQRIDNYVELKKYETISDFSQNTKPSETKRKMNSSKETMMGKFPKRVMKQKEASHLDLPYLNRNDKVNKKVSSNFSEEIKNQHTDLSSSEHLSISCSETSGVKTSSVPAPVKLQNSIIPVTSDSFSDDDSFVETLDDIRAFLSSTESTFLKDQNDSCGIPRDSKVLNNKIENQNIKSSETKALQKHSRKQIIPKKITNFQQIKNKMKKQYTQKKVENFECKIKKTKKSAMKKTYKTMSSKLFVSKSCIEKIKGINEISEENFSMYIDSNNNNKTGYVLDVKKSLKTYKDKKQNSSEKQWPIKTKFCKSTEKSIDLKQKVDIKTSDNATDFRNLNTKNNQNNLDLCEKDETIASLDKRSTIKKRHEGMTFFPMKKRIVFDYLKLEYLEKFNSFFQEILLLIKYAKEVDQFFFEIKKILLYKFISQKNVKDDLFTKYIDNKLHIENLKTNSTLLLSAFRSKYSHKSSSIDVFKQFCCKILAIREEFEGRFKFGKKMYHEQMEIKKNGITKDIDLHLLHSELNSIKQNLIKKKFISREKVYSFEDPAFSLGSELFSHQPVVLLERLNISSEVKITLDDIKTMPCEEICKNFEQTVPITNLDSSFSSENENPFLTSLLNIRESVLKKATGSTLFSSLISFIDDNVWPDEFQNKIIAVFETTMDIAQSVNNVLYNIGEYSCDISKLVLGNNFSHQYISRSLLVDSSEKKSNFMNAFSFPDETTVYPTEDSDDKNGTGQCYSAHKWPKVSVEDLAFTKQISEALGVTEDSMVDKSQNSEKTSAKSDLQNEIASFDNVSYEAKKKSCKNIEKSNVHSKQDSGNIVNKSDIHKKNSKEGKQNNKKVTDLKISKKFKRSSESFTSLKKQQNSKIVRKKNLFMCSRSRRKLLHNTLQNAYILSKSKKSEQCIPSIDANKECLTAVEANESFSTISESLISNNLIDNDSNACPTSTNSENLDFEIKEHTNFETLLEKNKEICAPRKEFMKQINILEDSNSKITCVNLDEVKSSFDNKISVTSFNDKYGKQVLNFSDKNENPDVTSELENIGKETKMDLLNNKNGFTTEIDHSQKQSSKKPKSKNEILSLCKSSLKKSKSVLRSKSGKSPKESSATSSKYSLSILYNTDEFLAALGEKKITAEKKRHAEIVMNGIRELGIEGFQKFLPEAI